MTSIPTKIHIIGSVGSGKTTLAKELSLQLQIPYYELDNVVWERSDKGERRRTEVEREVFLQSLVETDKWIIEGVHNEKWVSTSFEKAEVIIFLDTNYSIRTYRIIKRFIKQKLQIEKAHYQPTFTIFFKMFKWNKQFESIGKPNFWENYHHLHQKITIMKKNNKVILTEIFPQANDT